MHLAFNNIAVVNGNQSSMTTKFDFEFAQEIHADVNSNELVLAEMPAITCIGGPVFQSAPRRIADAADSRDLMPV